MKLTIQDFDREAFAEFGDVLDLPAEPGQRLGWLEELRNHRGQGANAVLNLVCAAPAIFPRELPALERHVHSSQAFVPLNGTAYLVACARGLPDGAAPDPETITCWQVPGTVAINYHPNSWHAPLATLDRPGQFAVFMYNGVHGQGADGQGRDPEDEEFVSLPEPLILERN